MGLIYMFFSALQAKTEKKKCIAHTGAIYNIYIFA